MTGTNMYGLDSVSVTLALGSVTCFLAWWILQPRNLPPGPAGLPLIGVLFTFVKKAKSGLLTSFMKDMHDNYGDIVSFKVGAQRIVLIKDGAFVKEMYSKEDFALRPVHTLPAMARMIDGKPRGIIFSNGPINREMRRFSLMALHDFGVGKKSIDEMVQTEATILCQYFEELASKNGGIVSEIQPKIRRVAGNIIHNIIFGFRYEDTDEQWIKLLEVFYKFFSVNLFSLPENYVPVLGYFPWLRRAVTGGIDDVFFSTENYLRAYVTSQIQEHKSTYSPGEVRDFIDLYIKYENENKEYYTSESILAAILDLFRAGTETTATTLSWAIQYLVRFPDIQKELREEIDEKVGDQPFNRKEKDKLVKTCAFINETLRYASIAPFVPPHTVEETTEVKGYTIPPHTLIFATLYTMHHDKEYWGDPEKFRISRWINEKGELRSHEGHFLPFSVGKRVCPGRQLSIIEVSIILVTLLQNFTFEVAEGYDDMSDEQTTGLARSPKNFHFKIVRRQ